MKLYSREEIVALINQIVETAADAENHSETELTALIDQLRSGVADPEIYNYIFHSGLTAEQAADKALSYKPICL